MLMSKQTLQLAALLSSTLLVFSLHASQPGISAELEELAIHAQTQFDREQSRQYKQHVKQRKFAHKKPSEQYCSTGDLRTLVQFTQNRQHKLYEREKQKVQRQLLAAVNTAIATTLERRGLHPEDVNVHVQFSYAQHQ